MSTKTCEVCNEHPSKYKCPHCELRYCSIKCFKIHIETHEGNEQQLPATQTKQNDVKSEPTRPAPANDPDEAEVNPYLALQNHPQFQPLFTKYPLLKAQLKRVHKATQNPYNRPPGERNEESGVPYKQRNQDRVQGQWTQDKADELAMRILTDLRKQDEGVQEFMALVQQVFGKDKAEGAEEVG